MLKTIRLPVLLLFLFGTVAFPATVLAQDSLQDDPDDPDEPDDDDDDDGPIDDDDDDDGAGDGMDLEQDDSARARRAKAQSKKRRSRKAREVVKGAYAKVNFGPLIWLPPINTFTASTGTAIDFSFGYDVLDRLGFTLTVEGSFFQIITNGQGISEPGILSPIQGDFRVFGGIVGVRAGPNFGGKRVKRIALAFQIAGGAGFSPTLVDLQNGEVVQRIQQSYGSLLQGRVLGILQPGLGIEYYTKLSHFSLGADIDFDVLLGGPVVAMGVGIDFFVKYTF